MYDTQFTSKFQTSKAHRTSQRFLHVERVGHVRQATLFGTQSTQTHLERHLAGYKILYLSSESFISINKHEPLLVFPILKLRRHNFDTKIIIMIIIIILIVIIIIIILIVIIIIIIICLVKLRHFCNLFRAFLQSIRTFLQYCVEHLCRIQKIILSGIRPGSEVG